MGVESSLFSLAWIDQGWMEGRVWYLEGEDKVA